MIGIFGFAGGGGGSMYGTRGKYCGKLTTGSIRSSLRVRFSIGITGAAGIGNWYGTNGKRNGNAFR
jgi:hypothetical protein